VAVFVAGSVSATCIYHFINPPRIERVPAVQSWPSTQPGTGPDLDALAIAITAQNNSIAAQANALTIATAVLGFLALLGLVGWAFYVKWRAEIIACDEAREAVDLWLNREGPRLIQELAATMDALRDNSPGDVDDEMAYALSEDNGNGRKKP
jgi:hypothetical protein